MKKQIQKSRQNQDNQFRVGTPPFVLRLARQIQEAAKTAGLKATVANIGQLQYLRIRRQDKTWLFVDIVDVPAWNYDDRPRPLATPEVVLWGESILSILPSFTQALCALGIAHRYAFVNSELDSHLALAFNPNADVEAVHANNRINTIVAYRRRTRRRIAEQGYPPIGRIRSSNNGYHATGNGHKPQAKTALGQAAVRLRSSGIRVRAN